MAIASLPEVGWALSRCQPLAGTSQRENPCRQSPCYIVSGQLDAPEFTVHSDAAGFTVHGLKKINHNLKKTSLFISPPLFPLSLSLL
mgnify:CR=1 FL=1